MSPGEAAVEPESLVVTVDTGDRIHVLDWGGPTEADRLPPVLLVHGLMATAWAWAPVARRLRALTRVLAPDLRGHGLSEAPRSGYELDSLAFDLLTVLTAAGLGPQAGGPPAVLAGHGFGAQVAATAAVVSPAAVAGLALVDGGWESMAEATGQDAAGFLRTLDEPPEILASMDAYLADRREWDPETWDADQERAARAAVDEKYQGRVVPVVRRHARAAAVEAMFGYDPAGCFGAWAGPLLVAVASSGADDEAARDRRLALDEMLARRPAGAPPARVLAFGGVGHNLMRYRPDPLSGALLELLEEASAGTG